MAGFADRYRSANCGWVALTGETLLIDLPRGIPVPEFLAVVAAITGKPARTLVLTNIQDGDATIIQSLIERGSHPRFDLTDDAHPAALSHWFTDSVESACPADRTAIGDATVPVDFLPFDQIAAPAGAAVWIAGQSVLFAGPLVVHGPRAALAGSDTADWVADTTPARRAGARHASFPGSAHGAAASCWLASADY